jgi:hypothetical protein
MTSFCRRLMELHETAFCSKAHGIFNRAPL